MRCLPCLSAVNGKELSSCLSEIFPFFLPTACTVSLAALSIGVFSSSVCHTQWRENHGDSTGCSEHIPQQTRGTEDFRWFFFLAENPDLEDTASLYWFQQTVSDPTKQLNLNQFWKNTEIFRHFVKWNICCCLSFERTFNFLVFAVFFFFLSFSLNKKFTKSPWKWNAMLCSNQHVFSSNFLVHQKSQ